MASSKKPISLVLVLISDMNNLNKTIIIFLSSFSVLFAVVAPAPPTIPELQIVSDNEEIKLIWDNQAEYSIDPLTGYSDFEGYRIYRSTDGGKTWGKEITIASPGFQPPPLILVRILLRHRTSDSPPPIKPMPLIQKGQSRIKIASMAKPIQQEPMIRIHRTGICRHSPINQFLTHSTDRHYYQMDLPLQVCPSFRY